MHVSWSSTKQAAVAASRFYPPDQCNADTDSSCSNSSGSTTQRLLDLAHGKNREKVGDAGLRAEVSKIKPEHIDAWLNPDRKNLAAQYAILDDRERPCCEHRLAA